MNHDLEVVVDTDVFGMLFVRRNAGPDARPYRAALRGRVSVIAFQTRAEILHGVLAARWGSERRDAVQSLLDSSPTLWGGAGVVDAFARLTAESVASGHALHQKIHVGDRWIASTAIAHELPLLSRGGVFRDAPGLRLLALDR